MAQSRSRIRDKDVSMSALSNSNWNRRNVLQAGLGLAAAGGLAACGGNTGRSSGGSGDALTQYFHAYGEGGTEQALKKDPAADKKAQGSTKRITGKKFQAPPFPAPLTQKAP